MDRQALDWHQTRQFSLIQLVMAFAVPSVIAYGGFHWVLPKLVDTGLPPIVAWPLVASALLSLLVLAALVLLRNEATALNVSLLSRMCCKQLSGKQWALYALIMIAALALASGAGQIVSPFMAMLNLHIPDYMPFFLNPAINPLEATSEQVSPGFPLKGQLLLIPLFAIALLLNILAEELYFRAWILPKMARYGRASWAINGLFFALYHSFQIWLFPTILVGSLIWAFVIYHSKSIYPALVGHLIGNFLLSFVALSYLVLA